MAVGSATSRPTPPPAPQSKAQPKPDSKTTAATKAKDQATTAAKAFSLPHSAVQAWKDGKSAFEDPSAKNVTQAVKSAADLGEKAASVGAAAAQDLGKNPSALKKAGGVLGAVGSAADTANKVDQAIKDPSAENILGAAKSGADTVQKGLEAAGPWSKVAGKAGARLVPGMNVATAAMDSYELAKTLKDPKASLTDKVLSGVTAGGSIAAATNIPVVSQIGAGVSAVSDIANSIF